MWARMELIAHPGRVPPPPFSDVAMNCHGGWGFQLLATVSAKQMLDRMYGALREISISKNMIENTDIPSSVLEALCDDLNTPKAIAEIFKLVKKLNKAKHHNDKELLAAAIYVSGNIMGLLGSSPDQWFSKNTDNRISEEEIEELIVQREKARAEEDFDQADSLRKQIEKIMPMPQQSFNYLLV